MRSRTRVGLAVGGTAAVAGILAAVLGMLVAGSTSDEPAPRTVTRVQQVGGQVAVVQIVEGADSAELARSARRDALPWVLAAALVAAVPAGLVALVATGRALDRTMEEAVSGANAVLAADRAQGRAEVQEVAHELRTPLAVAAMNLDLALGGAPGDGAEQIVAARRAIERMGRTVDDLATHGRLAVEPGADGRVDLAVEARALAGEQAGPAGIRGLGLALDGPRSLELPADRAGVRTAVGNLLANAVRLAPTGSVVTIGWGSIADWAWIGVRDAGPGIDPADHDRVFERHWRGRYETDRDDGIEPVDRGLGLTIARQVTEAQGGRLTVASRPGEGSTFVVWLPRSPNADTAAIVAADGVHHVVEPFATAPTE
jgi:signal transduction histidine kinase